MIKRSMMFMLLIMLVANIEAQDCEAYFPLEEGAEVELHSFNAKDKLTGKTFQKFVSKEGTAEGLEITVHQINQDDKGKNLGETNLKYRCSGDNFYIDMNSFVSPQQKEGYQEGQIKITTENLDIPANPSVGQTLKDGFFEMKMITDSPISMSMSISITNRKVEAIEDVTTPAGTFKCYKITQDVTSKTAFITTTVHSICWYSKNVGIVKSETYNKGKLFSREVLAALENNFPSEIKY